MTLATAVLWVAIPVAILLVMWPTQRSGHRLLRDWGIPQPSPDQIAVAIRYLWQRRIPCVLLFLVVPPLSRAVLPRTELPAAGVVLPLLGALLIAELVAVSRPVSGVRVASLDPRGWRDLVPRWVVIPTAVLVVLVVAWSVAGLVAQPWADRFAAAAKERMRHPPEGGYVDYAGSYLSEMTTSTSWLALGTAAAAIGLTALLVRLAVRRPAVGDAAVDAALRTRTARVAVGIGLGWLGTAVLLATQRIQALHDITTMPDEAMPAPPAWLVDGLDTASVLVGLAAQFGAIGCWIWVANPTRRALAKARG